MRFFTLLTFTFLSVLGTAQTTSDFENFGLEDEEFLNDAGNDLGFSSGNIFLHNSYNSEFFFWSGWAISNTTDTATPGFMNDGSSASGSGANSTSTYAVAYIFGDQTLQLTGAAAGGGVEGFYINNNTYAYLSMRDGDTVAKKFGGETGDDPDFFLLTIHKYLNGELGVDSINFYLADFRSEDNMQDYIINEWTYIDLTSLGNIERLSFTLSSSDVGAFGMNTPAYFCMDDFTTTDMVSATPRLNIEANVSIFPNPSTDFININWQESSFAKVSIYNMNGQLIQCKNIQKGNNTIEVSAIPRGAYLLKFRDENGVYTQVFSKQ